jgi:hypothetical protein
MDIKITHNRIGTIDDVMKNSDEQIVYRCLKCQSILLPKEIHMLKMPIYDKEGRRTWWVIELCPICFPNPHDYIANNDVESSQFLPLTREQFFVTRQYEKANLLPPNFNGLKENSVIVN